MAVFDASKLPFDDNPRVIVTLNSGKDWDAAEVVETDYKLKNNDLKYCKTAIETKSVNDIVPFRVKILTTGGLRPVLGKDSMREWTGENLVRSRVDGQFFATISADEFPKLFTLAVTLRNLRALSWMYQWEAGMQKNALDELDGKILLKNAIHSEQINMLPASSADSDLESKLVKELAEVLEWLKDHYKYGFDDYTDNLLRTPEHVAALRGDSVLLRLILSNPPQIHKLDEHKYMPFMYAARKGHLHLLDQYMSEISAGVGRWKEEDLKHKDMNGRDCMDQAKDDETKAKLLNILQLLRGEEVVPSLTVAEYQAKMEDLDTAFRQSMMMEKKDVSELEALIFAAQEKSKSYISMNPKLDASLEKSLLVLGDREAFWTIDKAYLDGLVKEEQTEYLTWLRERLSPDQCLQALYTAAAYDKLPPFIVLSSKVDMKQGVDDGKKLFIDVAVAGLSSRVVSYLISGGLVPKDFKRGSMLMHICVNTYKQRPTYPLEPEDRTEILKMLDEVVHNVDYRDLLYTAIDNLRCIYPEDHVPIPQSLVTWLVDEKKCDLLPSIRKPLKEYLTSAPWLGTMYNDLVEARTMEEKTCIALKIQPIVRGFIRRQKNLKDHPDFGTWAALLVQIERLKTSSLSESFGKTWAELKLANKYVAQSNEFDIYEEEALGVRGEGDSVQQNSKDWEEDDEISEITSDMIGGTPGEAIVSTILLTSEALKWLKGQKDQRYRELFHKRVVQLAKGGESYCLSKRLKGSKHGAIETKLDKGQRIIWTERGADRMIWFVCKHDKISRCCELIDLSYDRVIKTAAHEEFDVEEKLYDDDEPEMLANPIANVPLKIHAIEVDKLSRLLVDAEWTPPLRLTSNEQDIVNTEGSVLLIGRSGTGKTLCVCNRMARDHAVHGGKLRQLFVSRTSRLCDYVEALQKRAGEDMTRVRMTRVDDLIDEVSKAIEPEKQWLAKYYVTFERFCKLDIWGKAKGEDTGLDPEQVWTQIRSFIKGSCEATLWQRPLTEEEYLNFDVISKNRCRLNLDLRRAAYHIYEKYQRILGDKKLWDEVDRARHVYAVANNKFIEEGDVHGLLYDRVYIDEIQDITQAEVTLLILLIGNNFNGIFFAGDTAQTVSQGVDFRFEELRQVVYKISGDSAKDKLPKPARLARNFRSHNGILSVSNLVLNRLHAAFPEAASKLPPDTGLVLGPRPGIITMSHEQMAIMMQKNSRLRVLIRDECKPRIHEALGDAVKSSCLGIREAKGLEFRDVVILDFFGTSAIDAKAWKTLLLGDPRKDMKEKTSYDDIPISMELELKLLYTAITRSCDRLFFIESSSSKTFDFWSRCLKGGELAHEIKSNDFIEQGVMTADDWMIEGIEIASQVSDSGTAEATAMLERAIFNFQKAAHKKYEEKCVANLKALQLGADAELFDDNASTDISVDDDTRKKAVEAVSAYLDAEMVNEAIRACRRFCTSMGLRNFLISEIQELRLRGAANAREIARQKVIEA